MKKGLFYDFVQQTNQQEEDMKKVDKKHSITDINEKSKPDDNEVVPNKGDDGKLIEEETSLTGSVSLHVLKEYINKMGPTMFCLFILTTIAEKALHAGGIFWLSDWTDNSRFNVSHANDEASFRQRSFRRYLKLNANKLYIFLLW